MDDTIGMRQVEKFTFSFLDDMIHNPNQYTEQEVLRWARCSMSFMSKSAPPAFDWSTYMQKMGNLMDMISGGIREVTRATDPCKRRRLDV